MAARWSIFLGKGGVGRTTLACAFAVDRARAGERVLLVGVSGDDTAFRIAREAEGVDLGGRLEWLHLDARKLVDDIVRKVTRLGPMSEFILRHPSYESLVDIVPGVREMALFHHLERKRHASTAGPDGAPFDRIVLDAPATGHGIHFLAAPEKTARILAGPLKARAEEIRDVLKDPAATDVVIVTLAEEMPAREAAELADALKEQGFPLDNVVVNRWLPAVFHDPGAREALAAVERDPARMGASPEWAAALARIATHRAEQDAHLRRLRQIDAKLSIVPLIPDPSRRLLRVAEAMRPEVGA